MSDASMDAMFVIFIFIAIICGAIAIGGFLTETLPAILQRIHRRRNAKRSGRYRHRPNMHSGEKQFGSDAIEHVPDSAKENA